MQYIVAYVVYIVFKLRFYCKMYNATHYFPICYITSIYLNKINMPDTFIKNNLSIVISFVVAVFTAGGIFAEFTAIKNELTMVHERLDKKIVVINKLEDRILNLEKHLEYERGYIEATNKNKD